MPSNCCYFVPLRIGSIILGVLGTLVSLFGIVGTGRRWPFIIFGILFLFPSACLLFGAIKNHENALLASIVMGAASFLISIIIALIALAMIQSINPELANDCEALSAYLDCGKFTSEWRKIFGYGYMAFATIYVYFWCQALIFLTEMTEKTALQIFQTLRKGESSANEMEMRAGGESSPA